MGEGVVGRQTSSNPTIIRTFPVRVIWTIQFMLPPSFLNLICLPTERTNKPTLGDCSACIMLSMVVLTHQESTGILLHTDRACHLVTLHTCLCVLCPCPSGSKNLPTLTTWEFLTPMDAHMDSQSVVCLEDLSAHRTGCLSSGDSLNLVWDLSDFTGLHSLW